MIYFGDCKNVLKTFGDNTVAHIITSPPYNIGKSRDGCYKYSILKDKQHQEEYYTFISTSLHECIRVSQYYVFFVFQVLRQNKLIYCQIFDIFKNNIKDVIIWYKVNSQPAIQRTCLSSAFEIILILTKAELAQKRTFERVNWNNREKNNQVYNVIKGHVMAHGVRNVYKNRAVFPEYLVEFIISKFTQPGDIILDPFMGSGTVGVVCKKHNRDFIGIDIDVEQCAIAQRRIDESIR